MTALALLIAMNAFAADQIVEDIRISKSDDQAAVEIDLSCPMRLQSETSLDSGMAVQIRVSPLDACRQNGIGTGFFSERTRPVGGQLAYLLSVEYESLGLGETILTLQFDRPVDYRVTQRGRLRSLQVDVQLDPGSQAVVTAPLDVEIPEARPAPARREVEETPPAPDREPLQIRVREPGGLADYMVNLQSRNEAVDPKSVDLSTQFPGKALYVSQVTLNGEVWYRLRLGFFASEAEALEARERLASSFPRAWIGRAPADEVLAAADLSLASGAVFTADATEDSEPAAAPRAAGGAPGELGAERVASLMVEARDAVIREDYPAAIRIYTRVLQEPGDHQAEAREFLGVAREKNGQLAHARAEYEAYLEEYPNGDGAGRVRQRLNGLAARSALPRERLRGASDTGLSAWEIRSGVSQYYRQHWDQFDQDQEEIVTFSGLISDIDFSVQHSGESLNVLGRIAMTHFYDSLDETGNSFSDASRVAFAYVDVDSASGKWTTRVGRQSLHNWGVLGRFDGAHLTYDWNDNRRLHYMFGYPVESTRYPLDTSRQFNGVALDFDELVGKWDLSVYYNQQTIEGLDDRQAFGLEARYFDERRSVTGLLDYDAQYGELNAVLVQGTWRFDNRMTLSALVDDRNSPFLTTRNALIGQPVDTIGEMLLVWNSEEIRRIAMDRTASSLTTTVGVSKPIGERFQINADLTRAEVEGTVASAGVPALPGTGPQTYFSASVVGTSLFADRDVSIFNLRIGNADTFEIRQLTWDARFPVGRRVRLNPRLRLSSWTGLMDGRTRDTVSASFRFLLNLRNHYRMELELGTDDVERTDTGGVRNSTGRYINLGYRADF